MSCNHKKNFFYAAEIACDICHLRSDYEPQASRLAVDQLFDVCEGELFEGLFVELLSKTLPLRFI